VNFAPTYLRNIFVEVDEDQRQVKRKPAVAVRAATTVTEPVEATRRPEHFRSYRPLSSFGALTEVCMGVGPFRRR
jgi:hypothetical protein